MRSERRGKKRKPDSKIKVRWRNFVFFIYIQLFYLREGLATFPFSPSCSPVGHHPFPFALNSVFLSSSFFFYPCTPQHFFAHSLSVSQRGSHFLLFGGSIVAATQGSSHSLCQHFNSSPLHHCCSMEQEELVMHVHTHIHTQRNTHTHTIHSGQCPSVKDSYLNPRVQIKT